MQDTCCHLRQLKKKTHVAFRAAPRFPWIASTSAWQEPRRNTRCKRHRGIPQTETKKPVNLNIHQHSRHLRRHVFILTRCESMGGDWIVLVCVESYPGEHQNTPK